MAALHHLDMMVGPRSRRFAGTSQRRREQQREGYDHCKESSDAHLADMPTSAGRFNLCRVRRFRPPSFGGCHE